MRSRSLRVEREDGGVLVAGAILMAALVLLGAAVIQVGAWFQDRRHLQVRADAGALAGAQLFNQCFDPAFTAADAKANMEKAASQYAGFTDYLGTPLAAPYTPARNTSFSTGDNAALFQSRTYPGGSGDAPDDTNVSNECDPGNLALDVKLTRDNIAGFFSFSPLASVHGHARVQLEEVQSIVPSFPLAVPEIVPNAVGVTFVNEETGVELTGCSGAGLDAAAGPCTFDLTNSAPPGTDPFNLGPWVLSGLVVNLPTIAANGAPVRVGMRVGVGAAVQSCAGFGNGTTWQCYNTDASPAHPHGVVMVTDLPATQPLPKLLAVSPSTDCSGSPFAGVAPTTPPCHGMLSATIDFGADPTTLGATVKATITQNHVTPTPNQSVTLQYQGGNVWSAPLTTTIFVNPPAGGSEYTVDISWKTTTGVGAGKDKSGSWDGIQRIVGATDDDDGPLAVVSLKDSSGTTFSSSLGGGPQTLNVGVTLQAPFNKLTVLRQAFSGSGTSFILCRWKTDNKGNPIVGVLDSGQNVLAASMQTGCNVPYRVNSSASCDPDPAPSATTPDCAQNKPCTSCGNTITRSLDARFGCNGGVATWPNRWDTPDGYSFPGDPRAVTLITTSFAALQNGSNEYPVTGFGAFYIAGVSGNACGDVWPTSLGNYPGDQSGTIWGYFIKYTNNDGTPSGRACKVNSLNNCVAVLTR